MSASATKMDILPFSAEMDPLPVDNSNKVACSKHVNVFTNEMDAMLLSFGDI